jgi:hypothetical protein
VGGLISLILSHNRCMGSRRVPAVSIRAHAYNDGGKAIRYQELSEKVANDVERQKEMNQREREEKRRQMITNLHFAEWIMSLDKGFKSPQNYWFWNPLLR